MAFDNHYPNRKDHRREYRGSKSADRSCRSGGDCPYCQSGRKHKNERRAPLLDITEEKSLFFYWWHWVGDGLFPESTSKRYPMFFDDVKEAS